MEPVYASRIKIDAFCGNTPQIPIGMTEEIPETSRLLDALEKKVTIHSLRDFLDTPPTHP